MNLLPIASASSIGDFKNASLNFGSDSVKPFSLAGDALGVAPTAQSLLQVHQLRLALSAIKPGRFLRQSTGIAGQAAIANSNSPLDFRSNFATRLQSTEEINTAPTSFQHNGPAWIGQTVTAPWTGNSTADATVDGIYDGSNGQGEFTFKVTRGGTHGKDDLKIRVEAPDGSKVEDINIQKSDPLNKVYELSNGLSITLDQGVLIKNDTFIVDTSLVSSSYTPNDPGWNGSTATTSIGGSYDGSNGTGDLTFRVTRGGEHGKDDLKIKVYAPDGSTIESIDVRKNDAIDKVYKLSNGLTFSLGAGELIKDETFNVSVDAADPANFTDTPEWHFSTATPTITGTYDGSNGDGTLTFVARQTGVHGEDDMEVRVFNTDGSMLETIEIKNEDAIDTAYVLSNGLSVTFSAGSLIRNETFSIDVEASLNFSTAPNPIESTAAPVLKGIYDGSQGTDTLTFLVSQEGRHGTDDLSLEVYTSGGTLIETVNIGAGDAMGQTYSLSNGLNLSLGSGRLALNETFTVDVYDTVPTSVNPDLSFNGTGANDPKLEDHFSVIDGSFEINGNVINVSENDSINSVLDRINTAGIDVTATFDETSETILMVRNTTGGEHDIVLSNDTSGFLAATKLANAASQTVDGDPTSLLADLSIMSDVSSGKLEINGVSIEFDINVDSLEDVIERIDVMLPGVEADFDETTGRVSLQTTDSNDLSISSGGSGFFAALGISEGLYEHVEATKVSSRREGFSFSTRRATARAINDFARRFNAVFEDKFGDRADPFLQELRNDLKTAVAEIFGSENMKTETNMGITFDFSNPNDGTFKFSESERTQLDRGLRTTEGAREFEDLFFGKNDNGEGLTDKMLQIVKRIESSLSLELGSMGSFVDVWA